MQSRAPGAPPWWSNRESAAGGLVRLAGELGSRLVERAVAHTLAPAPVTRANDGVAHLGRAIAVLESGSVRSDVCVLCDRPQQVVQLVVEGVLPPKYVPLWPPVFDERVLRSGHEDGAEALRPATRLTAGEVDL